MMFVEHGTWVLVADPHGRKGDVLHEFNELVMSGAREPFFVISIRRGMVLGQEDFEALARKNPQLFERKFKPHLDFHPNLAPAELGALLSRHYPNFADLFVRHRRSGH